MGQDRQPQGSAGQNDEATGGGAERSGGETAAGSAINKCNQHSGQRISQQVAAGGSKEMSHAGNERGRRKDGQPHGTFSQVGDEGGRGQARRKQQTQQQDSE